ncbi:ribosomal silencing factor RsfS-like protein, 312 [Xylocopa sonorina]|uniref:ribosomal silencing factor RsfS-like protein, 312 n=1 Tax=Xylocopa sonorina TaxID=1818115 RepID=UPI00403B15DF
MWINMRSRLVPCLLKARTLFYERLKPCTNNVVTYSQLRQVKLFSSNSKKNTDDDENVENQPSYNLPGSITTHKVFEDKDAEIIFDISERQTISLEDLKEEQVVHDPYEGINLQRGVTGVFEIEDLVSLLQRDNARNIFVVSVPPHLQYVNYIVVVTGRSTKHMKALAAFVRRVYKLKRCNNDTLPKIEGENSKDWIALDLGNIILHIFSHSARLAYDLETLWSVGSAYDDKCRSSSEDIMEQYKEFLTDLEPIENDDEINEIDKK